MNEGGRRGGCVWSLVFFGAGREKKRAGDPYGWDGGVDRRGGEGMRVW